jgi:saposin
VEILLKRVCEKLPSTVRDECNEFINEYEPMIADLIASKIKPLEMCTKLGMCKKSFRLNHSADKEVCHEDSMVFGSVG